MTTRHARCTAQRCRTFACASDQGIFRVLLPASRRGALVYVYSPARSLWVLMVIIMINQRVRPSCFLNYSCLVFISGLCYQLLHTIPPSLLTFPYSSHHSKSFPSLSPTISPNPRYVHLFSPPQLPKSITPFFFFPAHRIPGGHTSPALAPSFSPYCAARLLTMPSSPPSPFP